MFLADKGYDFTELIKYLEKEDIKPIIDICNHWKDEEYKPLKGYNDIEYTYDGNVYYVND